MAARPPPPRTTPQRVWLRLIRLMTRARTTMGERLGEIALSVPQLDVLSTLTEAEGVSQQELATRLYVTKGNISGLLDRLADAGLVERRSIPGDKRSHAIHLTGEGRRLVLAQPAVLFPKGSRSSRLLGLDEGRYEER